MFLKLIRPTELDPSYIFVKLLGKGIGIELGIPFPIIYKYCSFRSLLIIRVPLWKEKAPLKTQCFWLIFSNKAGRKKSRRKRFVSFFFDDENNMQVLSRKIWSEIWHLNKRKEMKKSQKAVLSGECCRQGQENPKYFNVIDNLETWDKKR